MDKRKGSMKITVIGAGYVGLVSAACFSDFGYDVTCVDRDAGKIAALEGGRIPIYEQGLGPIVAANRQAGRLLFTSSLRESVAAADVVLIAVGTPTRQGEDAADLSYVHAAGEDAGCSSRSAPRSSGVRSRSGSACSAGSAAAWGHR